MRETTTALMQRFQSTPSVGRATSWLSDVLATLEISIHALREESDQTCSARSSAGYHFNPRPPRGERLLGHDEIAVSQPFQSTPSARRATPFCSILRERLHISIHALREEGDGGQQAETHPGQDFNPRPPRGGRPYRRFGRHTHTLQHFNPRPPRGGRQYIGGQRIAINVFQSTPSARRATLRSCKAFVGTLYFNPRPPRGGRRTAEAGRKERGGISIHALREEGDRKKCLC